MDMMLISKAKERYIPVDGRKVAGGQFNTRRSSWLLPQVRAFIQSQAVSAAFDPFAGRGHLLNAMKDVFGLATQGCDIDPALGWTTNDSLRNVPAPREALIITNPPYLAKHSASRKGVRHRVDEYYDTWDDLYQVALDSCMRACPVGVYIVPETLLNSPYPKTRFASISILEDNPFDDTDCPVCVACADGRSREENDVQLFRGAEPLGTLASFEAMRLHPKGAPSIVFNDPVGHIGLRAVDLPDPDRPIRFYPRGELGYGSENVKVSSRLVTYLSVPGLLDKRVPDLVRHANDILAEFRQCTCDVPLSPFKGNDRNGRRRRRLDYYTARAILELAFSRLGDRLTAPQGDLFEGQ